MKGEGEATFVDVGLLSVQLLCCLLVRVRLYTQCLLDGENLEKEWEIAI